MPVNAQVYDFGLQQASGWQNPLVKRAKNQQQDD